MRIAPAGMFYETSTPIPLARGRAEYRFQDEDSSYEA